MAEFFWPVKIAYAHSPRKNQKSGAVHFFSRCRDFLDGGRFNFKTNFDVVRIKSVRFISEIYSIDMIRNIINKTRAQILGIDVWFVILSFYGIFALFLFNFRAF